MKEKIFRDIPLFVEAAKLESFSMAGESLGIPIPTVSRRIANMEKELGVQLFHRKSRKVELSGYGQALYERCQFIVDEADAALEELMMDITQPRGPVRFSVHPEVYLTYMKGIVGEFSSQWPGIHLYGQFSSRWVDLYAEPFDLDIRTGLSPDSDLKVRRLTTLTPRLYASPSLLEHYPAPAKPSDLKNIPCIAPSLLDRGWVLKKGNNTETIAVRPVHRMDNLCLALELVLAGSGISCLVPSAVVEHEERGELVPILPDWTVPGFDISVVMTNNNIPKRVRLFVDFLVEHFQKLR